jgi:hypothetical protein
MDLLQVLSQLWQQGFLVRVQWDPPARSYLVELLDAHSPGTNAVAETHIQSEEGLLPWLAGYLRNIGAKQM